MNALANLYVNMHLQELLDEGAPRANSPRRSAVRPPADRIRAVVLPRLDRPATGAGLVAGPGSTITFQRG